MQRIRPKRTARALARKINIGSAFDKYGSKTALGMYAGGLGLIGASLALKKESLVLPISGVALIAASHPIQVLSKSLPKRYVEDTIKRLIGKPRLTTEVIKRTKTPEARFVLYLVANAKSREEQEEVLNSINGKETPRTNAVLLSIARKAMKQQGDELSKQLYRAIRASRGIEARKLDFAAQGIARQLFEKKIPNTEAYQNMVAHHALPFTLSFVLDHHGIHERRTRKNIFRIIKAQWNRTDQKTLVGADTSITALSNDMIMQKLGKELGSELSDFLPRTQDKRAFLHNLSKTGQDVSNYLHTQVIGMMVIARIRSML
jgi:hypothetical protein